MSRRSRSRERHHERYSTTDRHSDDYSRYGDDQNKYRDRDDYDRRGTSRRYEDQRSTDTKPRDRSRDRSRYEDSYRNRDRDYDRNRSHDKGKFDRGQPSYDKDRPYGKDEERAHISREEALNLPRSTTQAAHKAEPSSSSPPSEQVSPELTEEVVVLAGQALGKLAVSETCFLSKAEREALAKVRSVKGDKVTTKDLLALTSSLTSGTNVSGEAKSQPSGSQQRSEPKRELNSQHISITDKTVVNTAPAKKKSTLAVLSLAASQNKNLFAASGLAVPALTSITTTTTAPAATGLGAGVSSSREGKEGRDGPVRSKSQERLQMDIKRHYLGSAAIEDSESGRLDKTREKPKSKYQFEWSLTDDTMSKEYDPLYQGKFTKLLGRGHDKLVGENVHKQKVAVNEGALAFVSEEERDRHVTRENRNKAKYEAMVSHSRHWRDKSLSEMEERDWRIFREDFSITTRGANMPRPLRFWEEAGLPPALMDAIAAAGYKEPSPIQRASLPVGLSNRDIIGVAETGSGKTAAFLLPLLCYVMRQPKLTAVTSQDGPYAIVMAPARELAQQIHEEAEKFGKYVGVRSVCVVGGQSVHDQATRMSLGAEVIIATPGRLFDLLQQRLLVLNQCNYIVLDEADRMLDMGFEPQIQAVMDSMPATNMRPLEDTSNSGAKHYRQTIMFSATMPFKVEQLAKKYLRNPVFVTIGGRAGKTADRVEQKVEWTTESGKRSRLSSILSQWEGPIIIFCNHKKTCDYLAKMIQSDASKHKPCVIHSGKSQDDREAGLAGFKEGKYSVLITTDVMGRGIDVSGVKLVINYELPQGPQAIEGYTHRIGRTGRGGQKGTAISFVTEEDTEIMYDLKKLLVESKADIPSQLANHPAAKNPLGSSTDILW